MVHLILNKGCPMGPLKDVYFERKLPLKGHQPLAYDLFNFQF